MLGNGFSGADLDQQHVARHFKQEIAQKEYAGTETVHRVGKLQVVEHRQFGETDIDPVDPRQHPQRGEERNQTPGDFPVQPVLFTLFIESAGRSVCALVMMCLLLCKFLHL